MSSSGGFTLVTGGGTEFNGRVKQLFDQLCVVEKSFNKDKNVSESKSQLYKLNPQNRKMPTLRHQKERMEQSRGLFKHPSVIPMKRYRRPSNAVPDYQKNPSKWTKYTLDDVPDVTNASNSAAAFAFLNQLMAGKKQEDQDDEEMDVEESNAEESSSSKRNKDADRIVYKRKLQKMEGSAIVVESEDKPIFRNSKLIMPECVVGMKPKKNKEKKAKIETDDSDKSQIKLGHLFDDEEED